MPYTRRTSLVRYTPYRARYGRSAYRGRSRVRRVAWTPLSKSKKKVFRSCKRRGGPTGYCLGKAVATKRHNWTMRLIAGGIYSKTPKKGYSYRKDRNGRFYIAKLPRTYVDHFGDLQTRSAPEQAQRVSDHLDAIRHERFGPDPEAIAAADEVNQQLGIPVGAAALNPNANAAVRFLDPDHIEGPPRNRQRVINADQQ